MGAVDKAAVAAFALLEVEERFKEAGAIEIGPQCFGNKNLGVGDLPQEKITDTHFTTGADQQIGIRKTGSVEMARNLFRSVMRRRERGRSCASAMIAFRASTISARPP